MKPLYPLETNHSFPMDWSGWILWAIDNGLVYDWAARKTEPEKKPVEAPPLVSKVVPITASLNFFGRES